MATVSISDTSPRVQYTVGATPTTGPWTITFPFFDLDDLLVYEDDTLQTRGVDYSVAGTAVDDGYSGGTITWLSSISSVTLTIVRDIPVERTTDFPTSGYFDIAALNTALDKIFGIQQELETKILRAVTLSDTDSNTTPGDLPSANDGSGLYWNGTVLANTSFDITELGDAVTDAVAAKNAAEAAWDSFDDTYLGTKASAPSTDNDGDALAAGMLYWNSTDNELKVYNGSAWEAAAPGVSGYLALTGGTMTGKITLDGNPSSANHAANKTYVDLHVPKAGGTMTGNLTLSGADIKAADNEIERPKLKDYAETVNNIGSTGGGTQDIDLTLGNVVLATVDTSANTFTFSNPPATGIAGSFTLILTNGGSQTVNWPSSVDWPGGTAPTLTTSGVDILTFITTDAGTTWYGMTGGLDFS